MKSDIRRDRLVLTEVIFLMFTLACGGTTQNLGELQINGDPIPIRIGGTDFLTWRARLTPGDNYEIIVSGIGTGNLTTVDITVLSSDNETIAETDLPSGTNSIIIMGPSDGYVTIRLAPPRIASEDFEGSYTIQLIHLEK